MYQYRHDGVEAAIIAPGSQRADGFEVEPITPDVMALLGTLWRRKWWMLSLSGLLGLLAVIAYYAVPPRYDATASVLIDPRGLQVVENDVTPRGATSDANGAVVESQKRVMISDPVLSAVVRTENLATDDEFGAAQPSTISQLKSGLKSIFGHYQPISDPELKALRTLRKSVRTQRVVGSYVIDLTVRATTPEKASRIANAIAAAYLEI